MGRIVQGRNADVSYERPAFQFLRWRDILGQTPDPVADREKLPELLAIGELRRGSCRAR